jgi:hypothetical protein
MKKPYISYRTIRKNKTLDAYPDEKEPIEIVPVNGE